MSNLLLIAISLLNFALLSSLILVPMDFASFEKNQHTSEDAKKDTLWPFGKHESLYASLHERFENRKESFLLSRKVIINRPINEVYDAIMTPQMWTTCYPETLAVGSTTRRPIKKGDLVLEKFLFNGLYYSMFRYEVEQANRPHAGRFHGIQIHSNILVETFLGSTLRNLGGTFEYTFHSINATSTEWTRDLHLYTIDSSWSGKVMFKLFVGWILPQQRKGATLFVDCAKILLEKPRDDYERELFA